MTDNDHPGTASPLTPDQQEAALTHEWTLVADLAREAEAEEDGRALRLCNRMHAVVATALGGVEQQRRTEEDVEALRTLIGLAGAELEAQVRRLRRLRQRLDIVEESDRIARARERRPLPLDYPARSSAAERERRRRLYEATMGDPCDQRGNGECRGPVIETPNGALCMAHRRE